MMKKNELCSEVTGSVWKIKKQVIQLYEKEKYN
jgi:hypothetical protein